MEDDQTNTHTSVFIECRPQLKTKSSPIDDNFTSEKCRHSKKPELSKARHDMLQGLSIAEQLVK